MPRPVAALAVLVGAAAGLRVAAALALPSPSLLPDEAAYALLGRSLWRHGELAVLGGPSQYASAVYPVVSALPYGVLRVLQVLAACGAAVAVYEWARTVARPWWALAAAAPALALPGLVYAGAVVPEAILLLLATLAGRLAIRALEEPSLRNQALLVAGLVLAALTRGEAVALVPAVLAAAVATRRVRALRHTWAAAAGGAVAWLALGGGSPFRALGGFEGGHYSAHRVAVWVLLQGGDLLLVCGVVPLCAVILLALERPADHRVRATVVYALALALGVVVETGVFAAGHADVLLERELLFALPPLFVGFAAWLDGGAPRRPLPTALVATAAVGALLAVPFGRLATDPGAAPQNPTLAALAHLGSPKAYGVVALVALTAGGLLLALPARRRALLPVLLAATLAAASVSASEDLRDRSQAVRAEAVAPSATWIDRAALGPVTYLYDGTGDAATVWSQLFWNERIVRVLDLPAPHVPGPLPQQQLRLVPDDGTLTLVAGGQADATVVVAPQGFRFRGSQLARSPRLGLALWRVASPPRIRTWAQGLERNGDLAQGGVATLTVYDCGRGAFHVVAIGRDNETLRLSQDGNQLTTTTLWPDGVWEQTVRTPARPGGRCTFSLESTSLVHLDTFEWTPS